MLTGIYVFVKVIIGGLGEPSRAFVESNVRAVGRVSKLVQSVPSENVLVSCCWKSIAASFCANADASRD